MQGFKEYLSLTEKLITFGNKAYPKFGNIIILAGGAGSGKGFVIDNLLGIEGKILDVDAVKSLAMQSDLIIKKAKDLGVDILNLDLSHPKDVYTLHTTLDRLGTIKNRENTLLNSIMTSNPEMKPNLIFDVTLKDIGKFDNILIKAEQLGYKPENIHLVWVINDFNLAKQQNQSRDRIVPEDILTSTHVGASQTILTIVNDMEHYRHLLDGDIVFAFNKAHVDSELIKGDKGGQYIKDAFYVYIKRQNKPCDKITDISNRVLDKIKSYIPKVKTWDDY